MLKLTGISCYQCGIDFQPNPEEIKQWAESGRQFEPTDWLCPDCDFWNDQLDMDMYHREIAERVIREM